MAASQLQDDFHYPPHALRLGARELLLAGGLFVLFGFLAPGLWTGRESFEPAADYRVPYELSNDYWLYERHLREAAKDETAVLLLGDSVIWGEYVTREGTLSHFLNEEAAGNQHFVNAGLNGLFPLALEGLVEDFTHPVRRRKVILHANLLWMTSAEADLSSTKEQAFNHEPLVPQFSPPIPCYRAPFEKRISYLANRNVSLFAFSKHLQDAYFDQLSIPDWTMEREHAWQAPARHLLAGPLPEEPHEDPDRGETSSRHKSWSDGTRSPQSFPWVSPDESLQLAAFKRLTTLLLHRDNELLIIVGPLNEHMIAEGSLSAYRELRSDLVNWLQERGILHYLPRILPSEHYGDASHPLTDGYRQLAREIFPLPSFQKWLE
jgi:hypothetical protein